MVRCTTRQLSESPAKVGDRVNVGPDGRHPLHWFETDTAAASRVSDPALRRNGNGRMRRRFASGGRIRPPSSINTYVTIVPTEY